MTNSDLYIGLISGTSVDGVDCVLARFDAGQPEVLATLFKPTDEALRAQILRLCGGKNIDLVEYGRTDIAIGRMFAAAALELLDKAGQPPSAVKAIGSHGQTVFHEPNGEFPFTLQLGDPNTIAQVTGITTVGDLRQRDMVAGGEGAPLAPLLHRNCFASPEADRIVLNLGGIANITVLRRSGECLAFDTGPASVLMDYWIEKHQNKRYDAEGAWAKSGRVDASLLEVLLDEPYFKLPSPKSTGRELFNGPWLESRLQQLGNSLAPEAVQATLLELTALTVAQAIAPLVEPERVYVCGGGAHNTALMARLQALMPDSGVVSTGELGLDPDWVEATAFAWMAQETLAGRAIDTSAFTGAGKAVILGGIYQA